MFCKIWGKVPSSKLIAKNIEGMRTCISCHEVAHQLIIPGNAVQIVPVYQYLNPSELLYHFLKTKNNPEFGKKTYEVIKSNQNAENLYEVFFNPNPHSMPL